MCSVNACRCVFAKLFQTGRILTNKFNKSENWEHCSIDHAWLFNNGNHLHKVPYPPVINGVVPSSSPSSLWLSQPFYTVMLNRGYDIWPPALPSHPCLTSPKALHQSCNAVAHFLTQASKQNVETLWRWFLCVEYSPQKKRLPLLLRDAGEAKRVYYTFHQAVVHFQAHVFFSAHFNFRELKRS